MAKADNGFDVLMASRVNGKSIGEMMVPGRRGIFKVGAQVVACMMLKETSIPSSPKTP